jgi:flagellar biogenesis protein FliO
VIATDWLDLKANKSISTVLAALSIVLGAFLLLAWAVRKRMPKGAARLPDEIIEVLGRTTLAAKQSLHLVRVGGKLIVVSVTAAGTETLTEITDSAEVARILAACQQHQAQSSTAAFRQVFEQLGREPAQGFLGPHAGQSPLSRNGGRVA